MSERIPEGHFFLDGDSLLSKWGFSDGDALDDWWWDNYDDAPTVDTDELLYALVAAYLVPALSERGYTVELERIGTIHNPVRARVLNGEEVDHYLLDDRFQPPVWVTVSPQQIEDIIRKTVPGFEGLRRRPNPLDTPADGSE